MTRYLNVLLYVVVIAVVLGTSEASNAAHSHLSDRQLSIAKSAFHAVDNDNWTEARRLARTAGDPVLDKLLMWFDYTRKDSVATFDEISRFLSENPEWPDKVMLRRAEEAISPAEPHESVRAWFDKRTPKTANGSIRLALALLAEGDVQAAHAVARNGWLTASFGPKEEEEFLARLGHLLTGSDYEERLDFLLWRGRNPEAQRLLPKVDPGQRALGMARLQLRAMGKKVDKAVDRVPTELRNNPGLVYERLRWRRKKERDNDARALLREYGAVQGVEPDRFWTERNIIARRALAEGLKHQAYGIASHHGSYEGESFAEGEWLAGWIALRFLQDPKLAFEHFQRMYHGVQYPVSRARAAYWAARAAEARDKQEVTREWLAKAANYPTTYYGQLSAQQLQPGTVLQLPKSPDPTKEELEEFYVHDVTRAVRILASLDRQESLWPFVSHLADLRESGGWKAMAAGVATESGRPDLAIAIAKRVIRHGDTLLEEGYPSVPVPRVENGVPHHVEPPLVLAIIRQESAYRTNAVSRVGARGLMQLMPSTARNVAEKIDLPYSETRLSKDPEYNMILGQAYMSSMLDRFNGSYVLSLAAYNAGPGRSNQWVEDNGDPRVSIEQAVDWVELIPFGETRNYVQRTLEHLQVYRQIMNGDHTPVSLENDLQR